MPDAPAVDAHGFPVQDPTKNVLQLTDAAVRRLDDLAAERERRQDDLRTMESQHVRELIDIRSEYDELLRAKEAARLDAVRAVDVAAVSESAKVVAAQQLALASQLQSTADNQRLATQALAASVSETLTTSLKPLIDGLAEVQKRQYETAGAKTQKTEGRDINQWAVGLAVTLIIVAVQVALHYIH